MGKIKGTDIVGLKKLFKKKDPPLEEEFLSQLSDSDRQIYKSIVATTWTPVETQARFYLAAGETLYPGRSNAVILLHHELAEQAYSGIYSIFLRIPSLKYVIKRVATLWTSYYDQGIAEVKNITDSSLDFFVGGFPDLPKALRDATTGHISVILQKVGLSNVHVYHIDAVPNKWHWQVTWG